MRFDTERPGWRARLHRALAITLLIVPVAFASRSALSEHTATHHSEANTSYRADLLVDGLEIPWGMAFVAPDQLLFSERRGRMGILSIQDGSVAYLDGVPAVWNRGQGGLLDIALPPNFLADGWIYITYSKPVGDGAATTLARTQLNSGQLTNWQDLLVTQSSSDAKHHFGSRIAFDDKGHVFFTVGDRGHRPNGQDLSSHAGSILRVNTDGSVPLDNPFVGQAGVLPEIWSYGHRNPQGIVYDPLNRRLWSNEHGPRGGDEINLILKGQNYGWPVVSHGKEYWGPLAVGEAQFREDIEPAKKVYIPSIAPGSLLLYTGAAFPAWRGNLFSGALKLLHLNRVTLDREGRAVKEERLLADQQERIRQVIQGPEGWLYLSTDSGKILRVRP